MRKIMRGVCPEGKVEGAGFEEVWQCSIVVLPLQFTGVYTRGTWI